MDRDTPDSPDSPDSHSPLAPGEPDERPEGRTSGVSAEVVGSEYVLHDLATGRVHFLNQTAALVWDLCDGTRTLAEIAAEIGRIYGRPPEAVAADVARAVRLLREHDLFLRPVRA